MKVGGSEMGRSLLQALGQQRATQMIWIICRKWCHNTNDTWMCETLELIYVDVHWLVILKREVGWGASSYYFLFRSFLAGCKIVGFEKKLRALSDWKLVEIWEKRGEGKVHLAEWFSSSTLPGGNMFRVRFHHKILQFSNNTIHSPMPSYIVILHSIWVVVFDTLVF